MKKLSETNWLGYAVAALLVLTSFGAVYWASSTGHGPSRKHAAVQLPPIAEVQIKPGFVGEQPFGLWRLMCQNMKPAEAPVVAGQEPRPTRMCRANARMTIKGPNNALLLAAGFNVVMVNTKPTAAILFLLPPSAHAADSVNFAIDQNTTFKAPLRCTAKECLVQGALPDAALEQMKTGSILSLVYTVKDRQQQDKKVRVDQQLHGFRQAYEAMTGAIAS